MDKKVIWPKAIMNKLEGVPMKERFSQSDLAADEYRQRVEFFQKSRPTMLALLEIRFSKGHSLTVTSPLTYSTSALDSQQDEDDGFYTVRKSQSMGKFVDRQVTIRPGTVIMLKSVDMGMHEFVMAEVGSSIEHSIPFMERDKLLVNTDIYEAVVSYTRATQQTQT